LWGRFFFFFFFFFMTTNILTIFQFIKINQFIEKLPNVVEIAV